MIISHKYKFIFIKTRKTAGTSIEYNLSKYLGKQDIITPSLEANYLSQNFKLDTKVSNFFKYLGLKNLHNYFKFKITDHIHANVLKKMIDNDIYDKYFKFCVEREPVDKCISYYFMRKNSPRTSFKRKNMTWDEFVNEKKFPMDVDFYTNNKKLIIDRIIRYENLDHELTLILSKLGITNFKLTNSVNNSYREKNPFVSNEQKIIIYNYFKPSLKFVKYDINLI